MKHHLTAQKLVLTLALFACSICFFSFRQNETTQQKTFRKESSPSTVDTPPSSQRNRYGAEYRMNDLDNILRHLDEQMVKLDEQMKKMDFAKMEKDINASVDHEKINKELNTALAKVDWKKMQSEIDASIDKVKNVDMVKMKTDLEKMKTDLSSQNFNVKIDKEKIRTDVSKAMQNARASIEKAKDEIKLTKEFVNELEKDGLIDKKKPYKIEVKDDELYINGTKQPKNVNDKYRKYFRKNNYIINNDRSNSDGTSI